MASFGFVLAARTSQAGRQAQAPRTQALARLVASQQAQVSILDAAVASLRRQLTAQQRQEVTARQLSAQQAGQLGALAEAAGTEALAGPGLTVTLSDAARVPAGATDPDAYRVHDSDVQLVVNALFAAGAEAVSVNGRRIVSTSPIRTSGDTIVVDRVPLVPPYKVQAVGAKMGPFGRSDIARRFSQWTREFGLGFDVTSAANLTVPAFDGAVSFSAAVPAGGH